jgi:uncharacterized Fe-S cluster protein YjdI
MRLNRQENDNKAVQTDKENVIKEYVTDDLIVYWNPKECSHAGKCWQSLPQVFKPAERPWITITAATPEEIIKAIDKCPTDALKYKLPEGSKVDPAIAKGPGSVGFKLKQPDPIQIKMVRSGPLIVNGSVQVIDPEGKIIKESNRVVLCRCGLSANPPFCDGAHLNSPDHK